VHVLRSNLCSKNKKLPRIFTVLTWILPSFSRENKKCSAEYHGLDWMDTDDSMIKGDDACDPKSICGNDSNGAEMDADCFKQ
jgi:hypothetical protein